MQHTPFTTVCSIRPLTEIEFAAWVAQAVPGDRLEYHRGFLGIDVTPGISTLPEPDRRQLADLGQAAFGAFARGLVHLVQERCEIDRFSYIAIARPRPKGATASLSELLLAAPEAA